MAQIKLDELANVYEYRLERERQLADKNVFEITPTPPAGVLWSRVILIGLSAFAAGTLAGGAIAYSLGR